MRIAFHTRATPFHGGTLAERAIGGSASALISIARALAARGHAVFVYNECPAPGSYDGVTYASHEALVPDSRSQPFDVAVFSRFFEPCAATQARQRVLWLHDVPDNPLYREVFPRLAAFMDRLFFISVWQAGEYRRLYPSIAPEKVVITRNGIDPEWFEPVVARRPHALIYTHTPFRGLDVLLDVFPAIRARVPEATLDLYSGMSLYGLDAQDASPQLAPLYAAARAMPGVSLHRPVRKAELARALLAARLAVYPCHFPETSCISAIECLAAGTPMVTSALAALPETLAHDHDAVLLPVDAATGWSRAPDYRRRFVDETVRLLTDPARWQRLSDAARAVARERYLWSAIAAEWEAAFTG